MLAIYMSRVRTPPIEVCKVTMHYITKPRHQDLTWPTSYVQKTEPLKLKPRPMLAYVICNINYGSINSQYFSDKQSSANSLPRTLFSEPSGHNFQDNMPPICFLGKIIVVIIRTNYKQ